MGCELIRDYRFEAAHRLPRAPETHPCRRLHGHSYHLQVTIAGPVDPVAGWLRDFADIDRAVAPIVAELDHHLLNDIPGLENPTCELLAAWLWQRLRPHLPELAAISVSETPDSRCLYRGG